MAVLSLIISALNFAMIVYGLKKTIENYQFDRTWSYIERLNTESMTQSKIAVRHFLAKLQEVPQEKRNEYIVCFLDSREEADVRLRAQIELICNLFTELGVAHLAGAVSEKALIATAGMVVDYWEKLNPLVIEIRKRHHPRAVYTAWERLKSRIIRLGIHEVDYSDHP